MLLRLGLVASAFAFWAMLASAPPEPDPPPDELSETVDEATVVLKNLGDVLDECMAQRRGLLAAGSYNTIIGRRAGEALTTESDTIIIGARGHSICVSRDPVCVNSEWREGCAIVHCIAEGTSVCIEGPGLVVALDFLEMDRGTCNVVISREEGSQ